MLRGGTAVPPHSERGGGDLGVSAPLWCYLWGVGGPYPMRGHCWGVAAAHGVGGGDVAMQGKGTLQPPRVCFGVRAGFCAPPLPGNPLRDVGFWGLKTVKAGTE